jgi:hypothetical protein
MKRIVPVVFAAVSITCLTCATYLGAAEIGKVGEKWVYEVEGPRPMSNPPMTVDGDRVDELVAITGEGADKRWQLKSTWGKDDATPSLATIDAQSRLHQVEIGSTMTIGFTPPVPTEWADLKVGGTTTFETKLAVMGFEMPLKYEVKRLPDESVTVPAGTFDGCRHIQMIVHGVDPSGQASKTRYDHWMSADQGRGGLIKEMVVSNYQSDNSQHSSCSLKQHIVPK